MSRKRVVNKQTFNEVHKRKQLGFTCRTIAQDIGISFHTVSELLNSNDVESYFEINKEKSKRKRLKRKMAKGIAITEEVFNQIKAACERNIPNHKIAEVFDVSSSTVSTIRTSRDFEDYKKRVSAYGQKKTSGLPIVSVGRMIDCNSHTKESEIMDIIKKQDSMDESLLQQVLWMTRTIGVTIGAIYDLMNWIKEEYEKSRNNQMIETNLVIQNQQKQIDLLERMISEWQN